MILNYPAILSHRRSTTVSLETYPLYTNKYLALLCEEDAKSISGSFLQEETILAISWRGTWEYLTYQMLNRGKYNKKCLILLTRKYRAETKCNLIPLLVSPCDYCATLVFRALCIWGFLRWKEELNYDKLTSEIQSTETKGSFPSVLIISQAFNSYSTFDIRYEGGNLCLDHDDIWHFFSCLLLRNLFHPMVFREFQDRMACRECLAFQGHKANREEMEQRGRLVTKEYKDRWVKREIKASKDHMGKAERQEWRESREIKEMKVRAGSLENQESKESKDYKEEKVTREKKEKVRPV